MRVGRRVILSLLALSLLGCSESPTEPVTTSGGYGIGLRLRSASGPLTLRRAEILLDGKLLTNQLNEIANNEMTVSGTAESVPLGRHVLAVRVLEQTISPSPYVLTYFQMSVTYYGAGIGSTPPISTSSLAIPATLATGDSVEFPFTSRF